MYLFGFLRIIMFKHIEEWVSFIVDLNLCVVYRLFLHHPLEYGQTVCLQTTLRGFPRLQCVATSANDKRRQSRFSPH